MNLMKLMQNAEKVQKMVKDNQDKLTQKKVIGQSGAGMVTVTKNGKGQTLSLSLSPDTLELATEEGPAILEELIVAALNDAEKKVEALTQESLMDASQVFGGMAEEDMTV